MMSFRRWPLTAMLIGLVLCAACAAPVLQPTAVPAPPPTATSLLPTATPEPPTATPSGQSQPAKLDLDALFPPGEGRELVLSSCESCHSWVCAVKGQRTREHWQTVHTAHQENTAALSKEQMDTLWEYLADNFNDTQPEPYLPPGFAELGCQAQ